MLLSINTKSIFMQTRFFTNLLLILSSAFLFVSCSKSNEIGKYIPENASMVVHLNGKSISEKLPWSEVKQGELFKTIYNDTASGSFMKSVLDNPENTGMDVAADLAFFIQQDTAGGYAAFIGTVKDEAKFKQFIQSTTKSAAVASEKDGIQYLAVDKTVASWKKDRFIIVAEIPNTNMMAYDMPKFDSLGNRMDAAPAAPVASRNLNAEATALFALKKDISLADEDKFSDLLNTKGDIHFWINSEAIYKTSGMGVGAMAMMNLSKIYEGTRMAGTASFENGKIDVDIKSYSSKEMAELWKKYEGTGISKDMASKLPSKNVAAYIAMNFKPEGLRELVKLLGMEGFANMGTSFLGFSLDDFIKANKGDLLFTVSDIRKDTSGKTAANVLFSTSIADKASFDKLIAAGKKLGAEKMGNALNNSVFYNTNDKYFAIGNDKAAIESYINGSATAVPPFYDKLSGKPFAAYFNIQYILTSAKADMPASADSLANVIMDESIKLWDNVSASGGEFSNGAVTQHIEINLMDKNTNSLKQLNNYLGLIGSIVAKKKHERNDAWNREWNQTDTTTVVMPDSVR
jgi:hypothetical protein